MSMLDNENFKLKGKYLLFLLTLGVFIVNFVIKIWGVKTASVYGDESFSLFFSQQSIYEILKRLSTDSNPFLHMLVLHYWVKLFGVTVFGGKLLSVIFSSLGGALLFNLFYKRFGISFSIVVELLFLTSGINLFYAQEIRGYAQVMFLAILSIYFFVELIHNPNKKNAIGLGLVNLFLILTHYGTFLLPTVEFLTALFYIKQNKKIFIYFFISQTIAALIFSPWFLISTINHLPHAGKSWLPSPSVINFSPLVYMLGSKINVYLSIIGVIVVGFNKKNKIFKQQFNPSLFYFFTAAFWIPIFLNYIISQHIPFFLGKYLLYTTIGLFISIAYLVVNLNFKKFIKIGIYIFVLSATVSSMRIFRDPENWPVKMNYIKEQMNSNTVVIVNAWWEFRPFSYYYNVDYFKDYNNTLKLLVNDNIWAVGNARSTKELIMSHNAQKIILCKLQGISDNAFIKLYNSMGYSITHEYKHMRPYVYIFEKIINKHDTITEDN